MSAFFCLFLKCLLQVSTHGYSQNQILVWKYPSLTQVAKLTGHSYRVLYLVSVEQNRNTNVSRRRQTCYECRTTLFTDGDEFMFRPCPRMEKPSLQEREMKRFASGMCLARWGRLRWRIAPSFYYHVAYSYRMSQGLTPFFYFRNLSQCWTCSPGSDNKHNSARWGHRAKKGMPLCMCRDVDGPLFGNTRLKPPPPPKMPLRIKIFSWRTKESVEKR